jgi:hypothetical protein
MNNITRNWGQAPLFVGPMFVLLFADDAFIMDNKEKKEIK